MQIDLVTRELGFRSLGEESNRVLARNETASIFSSFEWLYTWWEHFKKGKRLMIVTVRSGDRLAAIAPFVVFQSEGFQKLALMGGAVTDYKDFILDAEADNEVVLAAIVNRLTAEPGWDFMQFNGLREDSPNFEPLRAALGYFHDHHPALEHDHVAPHIRIDGTWAEYDCKLGKGFRANSRYQARVLARRHGELVYRQPASPDEAAQFLHSLFQFKTARWEQQNKGPSVLDNDSVRGFYASIARRLFAAGNLNMPALFVGGELVALDFGADHAGKYFALQHAFDEGYAQYSVGRLITLHTVEEAFRRGLSEVDFLAGDEPYKRDFQTEVRGLHTVSLFQRSIKGRAAEQWFAGMRKRLERASATSTSLQWLQKQVKGARVRQG